MLRKFELHSPDGLVGILTIDYEEDYWDFQKDETFTAEEPFFMWVKKDDLYDPELIKHWVLNRSPEPNYQLIDALVDQAGLKEYDPFGFFLYNKGRFNTDKYYVVEISAQ